MTAAAAAGPTPGSPAADSAADIRRARRAFLRDAHPDRGGDPATFHEGLAEYDRRLRAAEDRPPLPRVAVVRRPRGLNDWVGHLLARLTSPRAPSRVR